MTKSEILTNALSRLTLQQPFFSVYLHDMMQVVESTNLPTAGTDGKTIFVNPEYLEKLTIHERDFLLAHEICHAIYQHMPRLKLYQDRGYGPDMKPLSLKRMNIAADYIINATLTEAKIGKMPQGGLYRPDINSSDLMDEVYLQVPKEEPPTGDGPGNPDQPGQGHGGFDEHFNPQTPADIPSETEVKRAITSAKNAAKAMGKLPGALERLVNDIVEPTIPWAEQLQSEMTSRAGHDTATWVKPNRRRLVTAPHVYMPGNTGFAVGGVCVVVDTSGSVSDSMVATFLSEVAGILSECKPEWLRVLWTDTKVAHTDEIDDPEELIGLKAHGGGGTDMEAAFREIEDKDYAPDHVVVLTDGYTPYSDAPSFPVIWGVTTNKNPPYGTVIHIKEAA